MSPTGRGGLLAASGAERAATRRLAGVEAAEEGRSGGRRSGDATREAGSAAGGAEKELREAGERRGGCGRSERRPASGEVAAGGRSGGRRTERGRGRLER
jgi:hypothetical protein